MEVRWVQVRDKQDAGGKHNQGKIYVNSEHMVAGSEENKRQDFTINNVQGQELIMTEFKRGTWFPGISEVVKVVGMIMESKTGVTGHNNIKQQILLPMSLCHGWQVALKCPHHHVTEHVIGFRKLTIGNSGC